MSRPVRVMHFADTHFGVELYGRLDPETGLNTRLMDFKRSLLAAVDLALEADIDLALFAGDAYKTRDPRQTDQREFADCIRRLTDRQIPVALLVGNHDMPALRGRAHAVEIYRTLGVSNVTVLNEPELVTLATKAGPVRVAAMPYLSKGYSISREDSRGKTIDETRTAIEKTYVDHIQRLAGEASAGDRLPTVLMGHFWVTGARLSSWQQGYFNVAEPQVPLDAMVNPAFDYVALGHIHKFQDLNVGGRPPVVYCGSPDRIDFGEKDEQKGFVLVELAEGSAEYRYVPVPGGRPLLDITVEAECEDPTERIIAEVKRHSLRGAIVKLTYRISHGLQQSVRERDIRQALAPAFMVVSINRKLDRDPIARSRMLTESRTPREALELYIDTRERLIPRKELLLSYADPLIRELAEEG